jgi:spermidine/putrescine transport system permease protein
LFPAINLVIINSERAGINVTCTPVLIPSLVKGTITLRNVVNVLAPKSLEACKIFMITRLIAGNKVINVGTAIEEQFLTIQNYGLGSTIALFLIIFMAFLLIITKSKSSILIELYIIFRTISH